MGMIRIEGKPVAVSNWDSFLDSVLFLWNDLGEVRKMPRNEYSFFVFGFNLFLLAICAPIAWLLSHVPIIWPEALAAMVSMTAVLIAMNPQSDYFRALLALPVGIFLLQQHITFDATIFGFHIEKYLYYLLIAVSAFTLWRRFFNYLCWRQIDRICQQYGLPQYDQALLKANWEELHLPKVAPPVSRRVR